jgi:Clostripain family
VDSCAEASLEMFTQLRGYTTLFVGSEKDVPYQGLPYVLLMNDLASASSQGPVRFGTSITNDYVTWSTTNSDYSTTMGVFNITKTDALLNDLSDLSAAGARYDQLFHATMRDCVDLSEQYEEPFRVDFGNLMARLSSADLPLEIKYFAIQCTLDAERMVEHFMKYSNLYSTDGILVTNATGLTIYPASAESSDASYADLTIADTLWEDFGRHLRNSTITIANRPGPSVNITPTAWANPPESWPWTKAKLSWPESYEEVSAVVYRHEGDGLVYVNKDRSSGTSLELRTPGILTVAASATIGDQAVSYHLLNFTIGGMDSLRVVLTRDSEPIQEIRGNYDVKITTKNGSVLAGGYSPSLGNGTYVCSIKIPLDAEIGDRLNIEVRDSDSGALVGRGTATVGSVVTNVLVPVMDHEESSASMIVPTIFAALPGILVLCFAILIYMQQRKKPSLPH